MKKKAPLFLEFALATAIMVLLGANHAYGQQPGNDTTSSGSITAASFAGNNGDNSTLSVGGVATRSVAPDRIVLQFTVETTAKTPQAALDRNANITDGVFAALQSIGVTKNETTTTNFGIGPKTSVSQTTSAETLVGYTVTHSAQIKSENVGDASMWVTAIIQSGANRIDSISFVLSDELLLQTRNGLVEEAVQDARTRADIAASTAGMQVTGVKSIVVNDVQYNSPGYSFGFAGAVGLGPPSFSPEIHPGEQQVSASVNVVYQLSTDAASTSSDGGAMIVGSRSNNSNDDSASNATVVYSGQAIKVVFVPFAADPQKAWEQVEREMIPPGEQHYYRAKSIAASDEGVYIFLEVP
jgi:uncharacterized protein YggE